MYIYFQGLLPTFGRWYAPGVFTVEHHVRGKWACAKCETITQAPVDAQVIDKGIPTAGLLAQVLVAKYADHLPLYRQEGIYARAGLAIPRSTLAQWVGTCGVRLQPLVDALQAEMLSHRVLHADETPVAMLKPDKGATHWAYAPRAFEDMRAVVYDFCESRAGEHARHFLGQWKGALVCDIEREAKELSADQRQAIRQQHTKLLLDALREWMRLQRQKLPDSSATAKALEYADALR